MRLAFLHGSNDVYGASRVLLEDCRILAASGHQIEVCLPCNGPLSALLKQAGATVTETPLHVLRLSDRRSLLRGPVRLPAWQAVPDVVILWTLALMAYLPVLRLRGLPLLVSVHELLPSRLGGLLAGTLRGTGGRVQVNSLAVADWLESCGVSRNHLHLAYPAAGPPVELTRTAAAGPRVGLLGRVNGSKGHLEAVRLVDLVRRRHGVDLRLTLAGGPFPGQERHLHALLQRISDLDHVTYLGEVEDARVVLGDVDLLLVWSQKPESFGLTPLEAWSAGRRTVTNGAGGATEAAWLVDGIVVPQDDPVEAADALAWVLNQPRLLDPPSLNAPVSILATTAERAACWRELLT